MMECNALFLGKTIKGGDSFLSHFSYTICFKETYVYTVLFIFGAHRGLAFYIIVCTVLQCDLPPQAENRTQVG